mgnify:CR=1 FL=1
MSAFKQLTTRDVTIAPFKANKGFTFSGSAITASNVGIDIFQGENPTGSTMSEFSSPTGLISTQNTTGVYNSAKQLYYSNFLLDSKGDTVPTASLLPGALPSDNIAYGPTNAPRYENYLQSSLIQSRFFPTNVGEKISTVSIPQKLFGENIVPTTFELNYDIGTDFNIIDDGEGNLITTKTSGFPEGTIVGQIFYSHGIAVFTTSSLVEMGDFATKSLNSFDVSFSSSITIYEHQYKCVISENEFGYSQNPSIISSSLDLSGSQNDVYHDFATGSYFDPYITTVGLYNENSDLLAVAKLSYPTPVSKFCDTTILVNFDT